MKNQLSALMEVQTETKKDKNSYPSPVDEEYSYLVWGAVLREDATENAWTPPDMSCMLHNTLQGHGPFTSLNEAMEFRNQSVGLQPRLRLTLVKTTVGDLQSEVLTLLLWVFKAMKIITQCNLTDNGTLLVQVQTAGHELDDFTWVGITVIIQK